MKAFRLWAMMVLVLPPLVLGCANTVPTPQNKAPDKEAKIKAALAKLDPADRKLAEEQKFCAIQTDGRLGSMGKPVKVMLKGQPVFVCCKHCENHAKANPDKTLATVKKLKADNADTKAK